MVKRKEQIYLYPVDCTPQVIRIFSQTKIILLISYHMAFLSTNCPNQLLSSMHAIIAKLHKSSGVSHKIFPKVGLSYRGWLLNTCFRSPRRNAPRKSIPTLPTHSSFGLFTPRWLNFLPATVVLEKVY